jgi:hypothetical protein
MPGGAETTLPAAHPDRAKEPVREILDGFGENSYIYV